MLCKFFATVFIACYATLSLNATLIVTSLADSGPGTLRDLVAASPPGDTIQFGVNGTISLLSSITIGKILSIQGPGPAKIVVDAQRLDRAFITDGNPVIISGITITNGFVTGFDGPDGTFNQNGFPGGNAQGGAIFDKGYSIILSNCWLTGNEVHGGHGGRGGDNPIGAAFKPGSGGAGGWGNAAALYSTGFVSVVNCTFSGNRAIGGNGGAGGTNYNFTSDPGGAGGTGGPGITGAFEDQATLIHSGFTNCTFSSNLALGGNGGPGGPAPNAAGGNGGAGGNAQCGAILILIGDILSSTVVSNSAVGGAGGPGGSGVPAGSAGAAGTGGGGGLCCYMITCIPKIGNTILADNFASSSQSNYIGAFNDLGYNFIGSKDLPPTCAFDPSTQIGTIAVPLHPLLKSLSQNGGGLPTHATQSTSPVTDAGYRFGSTSDERGAPRPYDFVSISNAGDGSDIGAFELGNPDLGMSQGGSGGATVSWPAYYGDFILQSSSNLASPNSWTTVTNVPLLNGNRFFVFLDATGTAKFFRLMSR